MPRAKNRNLLVIIDHDNIDCHLKNHNKRLDFAQLMLKLTEIGKVNHAFAFMPFSSYHGLENINNFGFDIVVCQKMDAPTDSEKREDKVDSRMQLFVEDFFKYKEITDIVIMSHDKHTIEIATEAVKEKKIVTYFAIKEEMARELKDLIEKFNLEVKELPVKNRF